MGRRDGTGRRLAVTGNEASHRRHRLSAGDLLFEDGGEQRLEDRSRPADSEMRVPMRQVRNDAVERRIEARRIVEQAEERR